MGKFSGSQEVDSKKISDRIQVLDTRLNEQITQTQLLKNEVGRLEKEKIILEEIKNSKSVKEAVLQNEIKRLKNYQSSWIR